MSSALQDTQLIFADSPGSLPAEYDFVSGLTVQAITARVNGAGAAAAFLPTLSLYSQDGKLLARVPSDTVYQVGDTGEVTWAPFLGRRLTSAIDVPTLGAALFRTLATPQAIPTGAAYVTAVSFPTVLFDTDGMYDAGNPTRLTVQHAGVYEIQASGGFVANAAGDRAAAIKLNGATLLTQAEGRAPGVFFWAGGVAVTQVCAAGDYFELYMVQNTGANLNTGDCFFSCFAIGATP